jgi:Ca2+-dependent lipid-binding protein
VGNSDPYVVVKWRGAVAGSTAHKADTLNPSWRNERIQIPLLYAINNFDYGELSVEVWDKDFFKQGDFMGEARLTGRCLFIYTYIHTYIH